MQKGVICVHLCLGSNALTQQFSTSFFFFKSKVLFCQKKAMEYPASPVVSCLREGIRQLDILHKEVIK